LIYGMIMARAAGREQVGFSPNLPGHQLIFSAEESETIRHFFQAIGTRLGAMPIEPW